MTERICSVDGCERPHYSRKLCEPHYARWRRYGHPRVAQPLGPRKRRGAGFWSQVRDDGGCWIWVGSIANTGYGQWKDNGRPMSAHRWAYEFMVGPVPDGLQLDHLCRNRACVNPWHLEPVTIRVNLLRGDTLAAANVAKTHCPQGHPYDDANTYISATGNRSCVECGRVRSREYQRRKRKTLRQADS